MLLCEYLFLSDYSVRQFERLAELVGLNRHEPEREPKREREVNKKVIWAKIE